MEAHFVDNCLGEENKTWAVVKSDTEEQMEGNVHNVYGWKDFEAPPSSPNAHSAAHRKDKADFIIYTLHMQPDKESCSCYHTQRSA